MCSASHGCNLPALALHTPSTHMSSTPATPKCSVATYLCKLLISSSKAQFNNGSPDLH